MTKYNSMDTAPKDGTFILVWNSRSTANHVDYDDSSWMKVAWMRNSVNYPNGDLGFMWCVPESWQDEQGGFESADNPICWTELPAPLTIEDEASYKKL